MSVSVHSFSAFSTHSFFAPAWLPPAGRGNGLQADAWAPIGDFDVLVIEEILAALAEHGVPGHSAPQKAASSARKHHREASSTWRLWVGTCSYAQAGDVLLRVLPRLIGPDGPERSNG